MKTEFAQVSLRGQHYQLSEHSSFTETIEVLKDGQYDGVLWLDSLETSEAGQHPHFNWQQALTHYAINDQIKDIEDVSPALLQEVLEFCIQDLIYHERLAAVLMFKGQLATYQPMLESLMTRYPRFEVLITEERELEDPTRQTRDLKLIIGQRLALDVHWSDIEWDYFSDYFKRRKDNEAVWEISGHLDEFKAFTPVELLYHYHKEQEVFFGATYLYGRSVEGLSTWSPVPPRTKRKYNLTVLKFLALRLIGEPVDVRNKGVDWE